MHACDAVTREVMLVGRVLDPGAFALDLIFRLAVNAWMLAKCEASLHHQSGCTQTRPSLGAVTANQHVSSAVIDASRACDMWLTSPCLAALPPPARCR